MRRAPMLLLASALASGCGARQASDAESGPEPGEPDWSACIVECEHETCAEVCEAQGMTCAVEACPADPMHCKPDDCDMATSLIGLGEGICSDPSIGGYVAGSCDDPIEFIFTDTARCCCES